MAIRTFLGSGDTFTAANNGITVFGASGTGTEKLLIQSGVTGVTTDANIERVELAGNLADYKFVVTSGTGIVIQNTAGTVVGTIPSLNQNATVAFADGSTPLVQTGATTVTLGGQALSTSTATAYTTTTLGTNFSTTDKSTVTPATPVTPTVGFSAATASLTEGNSGTANMTFTVTLSAAQTSAVTVNYATANGTATAASDYTAASGTLTFAANETSKTITVPILGDTTYESNETFTVTLSGASGATLGTISTATGTITNDDTNSAPVVTVVAGSLGTPVPAQQNVATAQGLLGNFTVTDSDTSLLNFTIAASAGLVNLPSTTASTALAYSPSYTLGNNATSISGSGSASSLTDALDTIQYVGAGAAGSTDSLTVTISDGTTTTTKTLSIAMQNTLRLTSTNGDNIAGTAGADLILGEDSSASAQVVEASDTIVGSTGTDILRFTKAADATAQLGNTSATQISGIETIEVITATGGTKTPTLDLSKTGTDLTKVVFTATTSTDAITVTNAANENFTIAADAATVSINNATAASTAGTQSMYVDLTGGVDIGTSLTIGNNGVDELTINSIGTVKNTIAALTGATQDIVKLIVTGTQSLDITSVLTQGINEVVATSFTGNLKLATLATQTNGIAIYGGSGADVFTASDNADVITPGDGTDTVTGGKGNDVISLTETTSVKDVVVFGAGTAAANGSDTITGFTSGVDKLNIDAMTTSTSFVATGSTVAFTAAANNVLLFTGGAAGDADSSAAAITFMNANLVYTDSAQTFIVVIVDNNSTAIYSVLGNAGGNEFTTDTLTLLGTIDAVTVSGDYLFA